MQCSHHQKPSISSALCGDVPAHEQNRREKNEGNNRRLRKVGRNVFWVINKWETPAGIQTHQSLSHRTSFSHSASVEKTAADPAKDSGIGMQQRAAMRFVGGLLSLLSQQSAVSTLSRWAPGLHHRNVAARLTGDGGAAQGGGGVGSGGCTGRGREACYK